MPLYLLPITGSAALILGFLIGLLTFKIKQHWCPTCGERLQCVRCWHASGRAAGQTPSPQLGLLQHSGPSPAASAVVAEIVAIAATRQGRDDQ
ncbi:MAG: hypothetical protein JXA67_03085 [Micromonosporaceae bacterium]|nr:hypothetical protein [Micromonosporaceae bacterium]